MIQKKICMLGSFAVGKTSLVRQFVSGIFSEKYHTTVGVKIDKKAVEIGGRKVLLMLWDIHGEDEFQKIRLSYLRGTSGYFVVVDSTRPETLDRAYSMQALARQTCGEVPALMLVNKCDLVDEWALGDSALTKAEEQGWTVFRTSAKSGENVEAAFLDLAKRMIT